MGSQISDIIPTMKTIKENSTLIAGIVLLLIILISAYFYMSSDTEPKLVPCAIGDRYDIMTGEPCSVSYEEEEPVSTTTVDESNG